jgi:hypothetical protein
VSDDEIAGLVTMVVGVSIGGAFALGMLCAPAVQARRRGYSFFVWLGAGILANNPLFLLVVLGGCPHRKRQALRETYRAELDAKLEGVTGPMALSAGVVRDVSVGDAVTADPQTTGGRPARDVSLGDAPTYLPDGRSLGDEPTRGP